MKNAGHNTELHAILGLAALAASFVNAMLTSCICGYLSAISLPGGLAAAGTAWLAFVRYPGRNPLFRVFLVIAASLTSVVLAKAAADILWFGHDPLLGSLLKQW